MREKWIDNAKGIAIICIMVGHLSGFSVGPLDFSFVYGFHLVVFFILSGYTLKKNSLNKEYINKKFSRLMIPYFITCLVILLLDVCNKCIISNDISIETITKSVSNDIVRSFFASGTITNFGNIELGTRIGAIWFLPGLFFAIIFFQIILNKYDDILKRGAASIIVGLIGFVTAKFIWLPFSIQSGMMAVFFIWIGYEIKNQNVLERLKWTYYVGAMIIFWGGYLLGFSGVSFVTANAADIVISILVGICGSIIVYFMSIHMNWSRLINYMGKISLYILCAHIVLLESGNSYTWKIAELIIPIESSIGHADGWRGLINAILQMLFAIVIGALVDWGRKKWKNHKSACLCRIDKTASNQRNLTVDIERGLFIILMLVGHFDINETLRMIIYSCHMVAFVFISGYFYKKEEKLLVTVKRTFKTLFLPYLVFAVLDIFINIQNWSPSYFVNLVKKYLLGMSFSEKILINVESVGPVYFILLLIIVRILYAVLSKIIKKEWELSVVILLISCIGVLLGKTGFWLPWSVDIALYVLIFYHIGQIFYKYNLLSKMSRNYIIYFFVSPIWAYMIYAGSMEIAIRNYGKYGIVIIGAMSGILTVYLFSSLIAQGSFKISKILSILGENSMWILIIHTLLNSKINKLLGMLFSPNSMAIMIISILIQILIALVIVWIKKYMRKRFLPIKQ